VTNKEATARIKINKLLEVAGWRFFADGKSPANIQLEPSITIRPRTKMAVSSRYSSPSTSAALLALMTRSWRCMRGMIMREIQGFLLESYGVDVSLEFIS